MKPCNSVPRTMGCGAGQKWRVGCKTSLGVRWTLVGAGTTCSGWATARMFLVPSMPRLMRPLNRLLKKILPEEVERIRQAHPQASVELWSGDEHRIGLKPIQGRVWGKKGCKVIAPVKQGYHWMYLYGFVEPESGRTSWLLMPTVNVEAFELALCAFAQEHHLGPDNHMALLLDQAGWHTSSRLVIPEGLPLLFLPSHSPELQPAERLWPLCNEPLANRVFASLDELDQVQADRCRRLQAHPEIIRGRTSYHWWPPLWTLLKRI